MIHAFINHRAMGTTTTVVIVRIIVVHLSLTDYADKGREVTQDAIEYRRLKVRMNEDTGWL